MTDDELEAMKRDAEQRILVFEAMGNGNSKLCDAFRNVLTLAAEVERLRDICRRALAELKKTSFLQEPPA